MPRERDKSKKMLGFWAKPEEKEALLKAAKKAGYKDLGSFLRAIAEDAVKVTPNIKILALSALGAGAEQSGCGTMMFLVLGVPTALWLFCQCSA